MAFTLGDAARSTGAAKSTIFRAIKAGRLSATRSETGQWAIEPAELFRVFEPLAVPAATPAPAAAERDATVDILVAELRQTIADLRGDRDHWRAQSDHWRAAFESAQRQLPAPAERHATDEVATAEPVEQAPATDNSGGGGLSWLLPFWARRRSA